MKKNSRNSAGIIVAVIGAIALIIATWIGILPALKSSVKPQIVSKTNEKTQPQIKAPFDLGVYYLPSGWMGDGERGTKFLQLITDYGEKPRQGDTDTLCTRIIYQPGQIGWAGMYWQYPENNWGDLPGKKIVEASRISFWAAGLHGGERVEFKAGGINAPKKRYSDSFEISLGTVTLTKEWTKYEIDLAGQNLTNVIGAFAWVATKSLNPNGIEFYLDGIRYE